MLDNVVRCDCGNLFFTISVALGWASADRKSTQDAMCTKCWRSYRLIGTMATVGEKKVPPYDKVDPMVFGEDGTSDG